MSRIELQIVALGNFNSVQSEFAKLNAQVAALNKNFSGVGINATDVARIKQYTKEFDSALRSTGAFTAQQVQLQSQTEKFGKALEAGHLKLRQYFSIINQGATQSQGALRNLAVEQTKLQNSMIVKDPLKSGLATVYTPTIINQATNAAKIATNQQKLYNMAIDRGATSLINWGKNTQWAGRQLTVGLTVPLTMFGNAASKVFQQMDQELTRMQKVYGTGLVQPSQAALSAIRKDVSSLASELAKAWGTPIKETAAMAADLAATGKTGLDLVNATREALRLATLGELDKQQAMQTTVSLQNVYKLNTQQLSEAVNFLNAVENQTSTSLQDLVDSIPRVGPIVAQMGGSFKDTAAMMVAMKEAGVPAAQSANAIKSALASMINPTKAAKEAFKSYGIDVAAIAGNNKGNPVKMLVDLQQKMKDLAPLAKEQLIEKMFGKFQMSRISALLDNLNKAGSQSQTVFALMQASSGQLASMAQQELKIQTESTTGKYKRAVESLKADLIPIGEQFTKVITKIINFGDSVVKMLDKLGPMKNLLGFVLGFVAVAGPLIMLTGVFGNLFGYIMKGISLFRNMRTEGAGLKGITGLLTAENIAASQATELMSQRMLEDVDATKLLASAIDQLNLKLESMVALISKASNAGISQAVVAAEAATVANGILPVAVKNPGRYKSSKPKKFAQGVVMVPGSGEGDTVPAMLSPGEAVISASNTRKYKGIIQAIHDGTIPGFNGGGILKRFKKDFKDRQPAHLNDDRPLLSFSTDEQTKIRQQFGISEEIEAEKIKVKDAFLALWHTEVNQLANNGKLTIAEMIQYLQKVPTQFTSGGQPYGFKTTPRPVTHDPNLAYGAMAQDLGIPASKREAFFAKMDRNLITRLQEAQANGSIYVADRKSDTSSGKMSSGELGRVAQESISRQGYGENLPSLLAPAETRFSTESGSRRRRFSLLPESRTSAGALSWAAKFGVKNPSGILTQEYSQIRQAILSEATVEAQAIAAATPIVAKAAKKSGEEVDKAFGQGTGSQSKSRKAKKRALEYTQGAEEGLIQGTPALVATAEKTGIKVDEAVGQKLNANNAKSKMGLKSRLGGGMGFMAGSMAMSMLGDKIPGGSILSGAFTGASMGIMLGPWGAAAGAAIGLVTSGISELIKKEKEHAAVVKATFSESAAAVSMFGGALNDVTITQHSFTDFKPAEQLSKMQKYITEIGKLNDSEPIKVLANSFKDQTSGKSIIGSLKSFAAAQVASGMDPTKVNDMIEAMLTYAGKSHLVAEAQKEISAATKDVETATVTWIGKLRDASNGISANATSYNNLSIEQKAYADGLLLVMNRILDVNAPLKTIEANLQAIGEAAGSVKEKYTALILAAQNAGDMGLVKILNNLQSMNFNPGAAAYITKIVQSNPNALRGYSTSPYGPSVNSTKKNRFDSSEAGVLKINDANALIKIAEDPNTWKGIALSANKIIDAEIGKQSSALTTEEQIKILEKKKKLIDEEIALQQKINDNLKKQQDYLVSQTDLQNQIKIARAGGDFLKVGLLQQQIAAKQQEYNAPQALSSLEKQRKLYEDAIQKLKDAADAAQQSVAQASIKALQDQKIKPSEMNAFAQGMIDSFKNSLNSQGQVSVVGNTVTVMQAKQPTAKEIVAEAKNSYKLSNKGRGGGNLRWLEGESRVNENAWITFQVGDFEYAYQRSGKDTKIYQVTTDNGTDRISLGSVVPNQKAPSARAAGGHITGPGTGTSDSIPAYLSNGEYVIRASAVKQYGKGFFDSLNAQKFVGGGNVAASVKKTINSLDPKLLIGNPKIIQEEQGTNVAGSYNGSTNTLAVSKEFIKNLNVLVHEASHNYDLHTGATVKHFADYLKNRPNVNKKELSTLQKLIKNKNYGLAQVVAQSTDYILGEDEELYLRGMQEGFAVNKNYNVYKKNKTKMRSPYSNKESGPLGYFSSFTDLLTNGTYEITPTWINGYLTENSSLSSGAKDYLKTMSYILKQYKINYTIDRESQQYQDVLDIAKKMDNSGIGGSFSWNNPKFDESGKYLGNFSNGGYINGLPKFHSGGMVPGGYGKEILAMLQGGEVVLPKEMGKRSSLYPSSSAMNSLSNNNVTNHFDVTINVPNTSANAQEIAQVVMRTIKTQQDKIYTTGRVI